MISSQAIPPIKDVLKPNCLIKVNSYNVTNAKDKSVFVEIFRETRKTTNTFRMLKTSRIWISDVKISSSEPLQADSDSDGLRSRRDSGRSR